jgi:hypothetical protein
MTDIPTDATVTNPEDDEVYDEPTDAARTDVPGTVTVTNDPALTTTSEGTDD